MTTILQNAFMIGKAEKDLKYSLKDLDNCLTVVTDTIDYAKLNRARNKLMSALDVINKLLMKSPDGVGTN